MCEIGIDIEHDSKSPDHQYKHILSENMRLVDTNPEFDKHGPYLNVDSDDDDKLHEKEHTAFLKENTIRPQYEKRMKDHIKQHQIQYKEKERMGLVTSESKDNATNSSEDLTTRNFNSKPKKFGDRQPIDTEAYE